MNLFSKQTFIKLVKVIIFSLIFLFLFKIFFLETYLLKSSQMSTTLLPEDRLLVNKMSYGPRMPKSIFGKELPYIRLFQREIDLNDIVLFNTPYQFENTLNSRDLLVSRCVALPSDTVVWDGQDYKINGKYYQSTLNSVHDYLLDLNDVDSIQKIAERNDITIEWGVESGDSIVFKVSKAEASILSDENNRTFKGIDTNDLTNPIYLIVPRQGAKLKLSRNNIELYKQILLYENPNNIRFENDKVYIGDQLLEFYVFKEDYYWFLSDNISNSVDSRILGFVPFSSVVGEVSMVLYNSEDLHRFFNVVY